MPVLVRWPNNGSTKGSAPSSTIDSAEPPSRRGIEPAYTINGETSGDNAKHTINRQFFPVL
jgi:hypothetical protein